MSNRFGGFKTTSPLSSIPHNPLQDLASNCIRSHFGPTVQTVADCILTRGTVPHHPTLQQILTTIRQHCRRDVNADRKRLVEGLRLGNDNGDDNEDGEGDGEDGLKRVVRKKKRRTRVKLGMGRGSEEEGYVVEAGGVRAALIVLLQHSIVRAIAPPPSSSEANHNDGAGVEQGMNGSSTKSVRFRYAIDLNRATLLPRHPRYVDYTREAFREEGAAIVEELLVKGRMTTEETVQAGVECYLRSIGDDGDDDDDNDDDGRGVTDVDNPNGGKRDASAIAAKKEAKRLKDIDLNQKILETMKQLVQKGYLEQVEPILATAASAATTQLSSQLYSTDKQEIDDQHVKQEWKDYQDNATNGPSNDSLSGAKRTYDEISQPPPTTSTPTALTNINNVEPISPTTHLRNTLATPSSRHTFPPGAVWRVNISMFHSSLRALYLGRLVAERYGHRVPIAGAVVKSALKYVAHRENSPLYQDNVKHFGANGGGSPGNGETNTENVRKEDERRRRKEERAIFTPDDIMPFLPPATLSSLKNKAGGARSNLSAALVSLSRFNYPLVLMEVEEARGHPNGGKFEIATRQLGSCMTNRVLHQVIKDHCGDVAARICSILEAKGFMEAEGIADGAMVPAKDVREILNKLYQYNYISLLNLQNTKSHNAATSIYLWHVDKRQLHQTIKNNICRAFCNMRLRHQHEMEVGKDWIERKKEEGCVDENDSELDTVNFNKFVTGLERLETACLHLDETLMIMKDFQC